ncbi:hypothetical protein Ocin01_17198 [Orchesella cincta]|uniref:Uncharacterized protein n=1 Tax=Orchesella cincta TaxID=48709 RepID=A0A1D2M996_ORCCI|nr:hypothetical protein Ocin01_17198 [Orchesella cincta]
MPTTLPLNIRLPTPDNLPLCASDFIGNEIRATNGQYDKNTWTLVIIMNRSTGEQLGFTSTLIVRVMHGTRKCAIFSWLQHCNGTHCVCGDRKTFGADLEYVSRSDEKQTCFAKDMEPCSRYGHDFKKELKLLPWEKKDAKVIQYLVPADAWETKTAAAKINLDCATDGFWCQTVKEENKNLIFSTRCIRKEFGNRSSGQENFLSILSLVLLFGTTVMGFNIKFLIILFFIKTL